MTKVKICQTVLLVSSLIGSAAQAQESVTASRSDGQITPMTVYRAASKGGCAPLAVLSPGAGGTEKDYAYLGQALSGTGFTVIVMGHRESGPEAVRSAFWHKGLGHGMSALVGSQQAETARLLDTGAALAWSDHQCKAPFRVLIGHSMGAETVMLEAGASNAIGISSPPAAQHRFNAYIALSPEGPGLVFPEHAWSTLNVPMLVLTGTHDQTIPGGGGPAARQIPWKDMPASSDGCRWMGILTGATHMNFAGRGPGAKSVTPVVVDTIRDTCRRCNAAVAGTPGLLRQGHSPRSDRSAFARITLLRIFHGSVVRWRRRTTPNCSRSMAVPCGSRTLASRTSRAACSFRRLISCATTSRLRRAL